MIDPTSNKKNFKVLDSNQTINESVTNELQGQTPSMATNQIDEVPLNTDRLDTDRPLMLSHKSALKKISIEKRRQDSKMEEETP